MTCQFQVKVQHAVQEACNMAEHAAADIYTTGGRSFVTIC